jgi:hypothetical protein
MSYKLPVGTRIVTEDNILNSFSANTTGFETLVIDSDFTMKQLNHVIFLTKVKLFP